MRRRAHRALRTVNTALAAPALWFCIGLLLAIVAMVCANVFMRYVVNSSLPWVGELTSFGMLWMVFVGAPIGYRRSMFPAFTNMRGRMPPAVFAGLVRLIDLLTLAAGLLLLIVGLRYAWGSAGQTSTALRLDLRIVYMAVPVSGALLALMTMENLLDPSHPSKLAERLEGLAEAEFEAFEETDRA